MDPGECTNGACVGYTCMLVLCPPPDLSLDESMDDVLGGEGGGLEDGNRCVWGRDRIASVATSIGRLVGVALARTHSDQWYVEGVLAALIAAQRVLCSEVAVAVSVPGAAAAAVDVVRDVHLAYLLLPCTYRLSRSIRFPPLFACWAWCRELQRQLPLPAPLRPPLALALVLVLALALGLLRAVEVMGFPSHHLPHPWSCVNCPPSRARMKAVPFGTLWTLSPWALQPPLLLRCSPHCTLSSILGCAGARHLPGPPFPSISFHSILRIEVCNTVLESRLP